MESVLRNRQEWGCVEVNVHKNQINVSKVKDHKCPRKCLSQPLRNSIVERQRFLHCLRRGQQDSSGVDNFTGGAQQKPWWKEFLGFCPVELNRILYRILASPSMINENTNTMSNKNFTVRNCLDKTRKWH